jgi:hypothetical protein
LAYGFELGIGIALGVVVFCAVAWIVSMLVVAAWTVIEMAWISWRWDPKRIDWDKFGKKRN